MVVDGDVLVDVEDVLTVLDVELVVTVVELEVVVVVEVEARLSTSTLSLYTAKVPIPAPIYKPG